MNEVMATLKTILYVEESENALARAIIKRTDIKLVLIRFSNCMAFSKAYIEKTQKIPTFIINKSSAFDRECERLSQFLNSVCDQIDIFYNDSEFNQVYIQKIARFLGLPGSLTEYQALVVRDKYVMKQYIESLGLICAKYRLLNSKEDAFRCAEIWGFPFIIKWRTGVSSIEVYKIDNLEDIEELKLNYESGKYMAEEYQPDKIWCIDAIVENGTVLSNLYTWLPFTNLSFAERKSKFTQLAVGFPQTYWKFNARKITQSIISGLKLSSGYLHLEVFVSELGDPVICEFAWRTPGDHMLQNFTVLYGRSIEDLLIDALLEYPAHKLEDVNKCVADVFLPMQDGEIEEISTIEELKEKCGILDGEILYSKGDVLSSQHKYTDASGWVQLESNSINEMMRKIENIYSTYSLQVKAIENE